MGMEKGRLLRARRRAIRAGLLVAALTALWVALMSPVNLHIWLYWLAFCAALGSLLAIVYGAIHTRYTRKWMPVPVLALVATLFVVSKALGALADYAVRNVPLPAEPTMGVLDIPVPSMEATVLAALALMLGSVAYTVIDS
jgi:hypothetical protein